MPNSRSSGIFGDRKSGGGLFAGVPLDIVSKREGCYQMWDFLTVGEIAAFSATDVGTAVAETLTIRFDGKYGVLDLDAGTSANTGSSVTTAVANDAGEFVVPTAAVAATSSAAAIPASEIVYETRISFDNVDGYDWFVGLGDRNVPILTAAGAITTLQDWAGFHHQLSNPGVYNLTVNAANGTAQTTAITAANKNANKTLADSTYVKLGIRITGTQGVEFFIDDTLVHAVTTTAGYAQGLQPHLAVVSNGSATQVDTDYIILGQNRIGL